MPVVIGKRFRRRDLPRGLRPFAGGHRRGLRQFANSRKAGPADRLPHASPPSTTAPCPTNGAPSTSTTRAPPPRAWCSSKTAFSKTTWSTGSTAGAWAWPPTGSGPPPGLYLRAHLAHAQHLHRARQRRRGRDHRHHGRRPVCQAKWAAARSTPSTGEFNFAVQEGYLVKDGKIDRPVRGATLVGQRRGNPDEDRPRGQGHVRCAQGMCGSLSGSVPTDVGQPHDPRDRA